MKTIFTVKDVYRIVHTIKNAVRFVDQNPEVLDGITIPFHQGFESLYKIKVSKPNYDNPLVTPDGVCSKVEVFRTDLKAQLGETLVFEMPINDLSTGSYDYHSLTLGLIKTIISPTIPIEDVSGCVFERVNEMLLLQVKTPETGAVVYSHTIRAGLPISDVVKLEAISLAFHINTKNEEVPFTHEGRHISNEGRLKILGTEVLHHRV